jgi:hypothetical protein
MGLVLCHFIIVYFYLKPYTASDQTTHEPQLTLKRLSSSSLLKSSANCLLPDLCGRGGL